MSDETLGEMRERLRAEIAALPAPARWLMVRRMRKVDRKIGRERDRRIARWWRS